MLYRLSFLTGGVQHFPSASLLRKLGFPEGLLTQRNKGHEVLLSSAVQFNLTHFKLLEEITPSFIPGTSCNLFLSNRNQMMSLPLPEPFYPSPSSTETVQTLDQGPFVASLPQTLLPFQPIQLSRLGLNSGCLHMLFHLPGSPFPLIFPGLVSPSLPDLA